MANFEILNFQGLLGGNGFGLNSGL
jgi:hypothetical protein